MQEKGEEMHLTHFRVQRRPVAQVSNARKSLPGQEGRTEKELGQKSANGR